MLADRIKRGVQCIGCRQQRLAPLGPRLRQAGLEPLGPHPGKFGEVIGLHPGDARLQVLDLFAQFFRRRLGLLVLVRSGRIDGRFGRVEEHPLETKGLDG
ncbi:hypothetical protein ACFSTD_03785 [Novosphingobium colocasiae]